MILSGDANGGVPHFFLTRARVFSVAQGMMNGVLPGSVSSRTLVFSLHFGQGAIPCRGVVQFFQQVC